MRKQEISCTKEQEVSCLDIIRENVVRDFFTANIKAEVTIDMLLTPVLQEIMNVMLKEQLEENKNRELELIAKEFPLLNRNRQINENEVSNRNSLSGDDSALSEDEIKSQKSESEKESYHNCNVDYLMRGTEGKPTWYLVELKTTKSSEGDAQRENYLGISETVDILRDFADLLAHIFEKTYEAGQDNLDSVFGKIVKNFYNSDEERKKNPVELAHRRLKKVANPGSKKYLYTAAQLLEKGIGFERDKREYEELKLVYITPDGGSEKGVTYLSIKEMIRDENVKKICNAMKDKDGIIKQTYWKWLAEVLRECYGE